MDNVVPASAVPEGAGEAGAYAAMLADLRRAPVAS